MSPKLKTKTHEFYTVRELAEMLRVTEATIYRVARRGELPFYSIGRAMRFRCEDVEAFLQRCKGVVVGPGEADEVKGRE